MIEFITNNFNNREIAIAFWFMVFMIFVLLKKDVRSSVDNLFKVFFQNKIFVVFLIMTFYVISLLILLQKLGVWQFSLLKETIFWYLGVAVTSLFNANKVNEDRNYFKNIFKDNLRLIVILEFVTALYTFNLIVELIFIPILLLFVLVSAYSKAHKEYREVKKFTEWVFSFVGLIILIFALYKIMKDFNGFANITNLSNFLLPPILTFLFIPFMYLLALIITYEVFFVRMKFFIKNKNDFKSAKWKVLISFHFRLRELNKFAKEYFSLNQQTNNDIVVAIKLFKENL